MDYKFRNYARSSGFAVHVYHGNVMLSHEAVGFCCAYRWNVMLIISFYDWENLEWNKPHQHYWRLLFLNLWSEDLNISMDQNSV